MLQQRDSHIMWISSKMSFGCFFFLFFLIRFGGQPSKATHGSFGGFSRGPQDAYRAQPMEEGGKGLMLNAVEGFGPHVPQAIIALKLTAINWFVFFPILSL